MQNLLARLITSVAATLVVAGGATPRRDCVATTQRRSAGGEAAVVESVKAASDIYAPAGGTVTGANSALEAAPSKVNEDPEGEGWFFRFQPADASAVAKLLDQDAYDRLIKANAEA